MNYCAKRAQHEECQTKVRESTSKGSTSAVHYSTVLQYCIYRRNNG